MLGVWLAACAARLPPPAWPETSSIVETSSDRPTSARELADALAGVRAVYVGERHDVASDHALEHAVFRLVADRAPRVIVGLEMFQRPAQPALDDYVAGRIDEAAMLARSEYEARWGFDFAVYRPVFEDARARGIRLIALNAPTEVTRAVGRSGLAALDAEVRASLPELDLGDALHRRFVERALRGHPGLDDATIARFYEAQTVWDETMGASLAEALEEAPDGTVAVVFAGVMHVAGGLGIPRTAARRGVVPFRVVLPTAAVAELDETLLPDGESWCDFQIDAGSP